jgi:hypothetical protein
MNQEQKDQAKRREIHKRLTKEFGNFTQLEKEKLCSYIMANFSPKDGEQQLIGAIYTLEGIIKMNGFLRQEPSTKQLQDHLDGLNAKYKELLAKEESA